ncbi:hypothetical protein BBJ28_00006623 [Nothophytophthora sp. Chile5]|nr:hypothetical protein BBJ28_00006623 [Nothophytophthora sp. Chile5]
MRDYTAYPDARLDRHPRVVDAADVSPLLLLLPRDQAHAAAAAADAAGRQQRRVMARDARRRHQLRVDGALACDVLRRSCRPPLNHAHSSDSGCCLLLPVVEAVPSRGEGGGGCRTRGLRSCGRRVGDSRLPAAPKRRDELLGRDGSAPGRILDRRGAVGPRRPLAGRHLLLPPRELLPGGDHRRRRRLLAAQRGTELYSRSFAARKIVEIVTQIPHSYLDSTLIARPWINRLKVALVVTNCWGSFAVHRLLLTSETSRQVAPSSRSRANDKEHSPPLRFAIVVVDALLTTSAGVLLPSAIFLPYLLQFDVELFTFPPELMYGDTAFPNLVLENRAFFAISWFDAVVKSVPHIGVLLCLRTLSAMLETPPPCLPLSPSTQSSPVASLSRIRRLALSSTSSRLLASASHGLWTSTKLIRRLHRVLVPLFFLTAGAGVVLVHLNAQLEVLDHNSDGIRSMCIQQMRPWFAADLSCSVLTYNCYSQREASPPPEAFDRLEREALRSVIFSHCSAFEMPPSIRELPSILGIELWNVTLVDWGLSAALSAEKHPVLAFLVFAHVSMTAIPVGILQSPLPERLTDFEFSHTNLTTLPEEATESWTHVELLYLEHSQIRTFPSALMQLPVLSELSLIDNPIEALPGEILTTATSIEYYDLAFSRNPLMRLPDEANEGANINFLALEGTQLVALPVWIATNVNEVVSLGDSPICDDGGDPQLPETVVCTKADELGEERYPAALVGPFRRLELDPRSG